MTTPPESEGVATGHDLSTQGPTSHARTEEPTTDPAERDLLGAPPRDAVAGAASPDDMDVTEDPEVRDAVARDPGQQYTTGEG
jgi:hypothetical protein